MSSEGRARHGPLGATRTAIAPRLVGDPSLSGAAVRGPQRTRSAAACGEAVAATWAVTLASTTAPCSTWRRAP
eukprot:CAMPEP_0114541980 /NCGR_PEP_ID=MMETSP0114-20121206/1594_1 /TAXON_ID=31324 /ORGANISM="Goniomonas sp, Strain m" /LENGTH=72 /DNA_ID=CAMNT_0001726253 /DNA_START=618 /DNA_END=832 /DNA_ORIENTATION=-